MFKRYLICTDLRDGLQRLTSFVSDLAQNGCEQIVFTHTVPLWEEGDIPRIDDAKVEAAQAQLESALPSPPDGLEVIVDIQSGKPQDSIPKLVAKYQSDVVLTGTATRNLMQETIFGSTSLAIARAMTVPLTLLRPQLISTYTQAELALRCQNLWRYLLVPYSDSQSGRYLIDELKRVIQSDTTGALKKCLLLTVVSEGGRRGLTAEHKQQAAQEKLAKAKAELESCGIEVETEIRVGIPMQEITQAAIVRDITAIATGYVSKSAFLELTAPSFANEILRHSWFPVLFFSPKQ